MKVICDKNIWYNIALGNVVIDKKRDYCSTYITVEEFCSTKNNISNPEITRKAIQKMISISGKSLLLDPPFIYLKKLDDKNFRYDEVEKHRVMLNFTQRIANGYSIELNKRDEYIEGCNEFNYSYLKATETINNWANEIRQKVKLNKVKHLKEETLEINRGLINFFVKQQTSGTEISELFDWSQVELFENTLKCFFKQMESGAIKAKPNDWPDLWQLIYVSRKDKFWTKDKKLINIITKANMQHYLWIE